MDHQYRPEIDGLRAIAVIPVILFHGGLSIFSGGFVGVDVFFVISGYLITNIIIKDLYKENFSLVEFYERRARRILPALFSVMLFCIPLAWLWLMPSDMKNFSESLISTSLFSSNFLFWKESGYFDVTSELKPLIHTWSLAIEEQFYILFPIFLIMTWRLGSKILISLLIIIFCISLALGHWGSFNHPTAAFFLLPTRGWELLMGCIISFFLWQRNHKLNLRISQILSFSGFILICFSIFIFDKSTPDPSILNLLPTLGTALIILYAVNGTFIYSLLSNKILVGIGLISFSMYLIHQPLFAFAKYKFQSENLNSYLWIVLGLTFILSYLNWKLIETPFRNRAIFSRKSIFSMSAMGIMVFIIIGIAGILTDGFSGRFTNYEQKILAQYTDASKYVNSRFYNLDIAFDSLNDTPNILIIGDSFGEDLVNALYESDLDKKYSISTKKIPAHCGNLFVESNLTEYIRDQDITSCQQGYKDKILLQRIKNASEIWLVSSWRSWHVPFIPKSLENIKKINDDAKIKVFGRKHFGKRNAHEWIASTGLNIDQLLSIKNLPQSHSAINSEMREVIDAQEFIDISWMICGSETECSNKSPEGLPISYDGVHLTKAGARYLGEKLKIYFKP
jgi:peptidoglycan/LPS O-acetylase OafA/YrhL